MRPPFVFTVAPGEAGQRLDKLLTQRVPGLGRRSARRLFEAGAVHVAGRQVTKGTLVRAGDEVSVQLGEPDKAAPEPDASLDVRLETPDVVVADVRMKSMQGDELAARLAAARPDVKVLLVSGDVRGRGDDDPAFLAKPFTPRQLAHRVHQLLSG